MNTFQNYNPEDSGANAVEQMVSGLLAVPNNYIKLELTPGPMFDAVYDALSARKVQLYEQAAFDLAEEELENYLDVRYEIQVINELMMDMVKAMSHQYDITYRAMSGSADLATVKRIRQRHRDGEIMALKERLGKS